MDRFEAHAFFKERLARQQAYLSENYPNSVLNKEEFLASALEAKKEQDRRFAPEYI